MISACRIRLNFCEKLSFHISELYNRPTVFQIHGAQKIGFQQSNRHQHRSFIDQITVKENA